MTGFNHHSSSTKDELQMRRHPFTPAQWSSPILHAFAFSLVSPFSLHLLLLYVVCWSRFYLSRTRTVQFDPFVSPSNATGPTTKINQTNEETRPHANDTHSACRWSESLNFLALFCCRLVLLMRRRLTFPFSVKSEKFNPNKPICTNPTQSNPIDHSHDSHTYTHAHTHIFNAMSKPVSLLPTSLPTPVLTFLKCQDWIWPSGYSISDYEWGDTHIFFQLSLPGLLFFCLCRARGDYWSW